MDAELSRIKVETIDKYMAEFTNLLNTKQGRNQRRFLSRGAFLSALRDSLDSRLKDGWDYIEANPSDLSAADLWFSLLDRYEKICDLLFSARGEVSLEKAAVSIFDGVAYDNDRGTISLSVAGRNKGGATGLKG